MSSVDHVDSDDWRNGVSFHQVQECARVFGRCAARSGKIPLARIRSLLHTLPQPLGFRNKLGELRIGLHVCFPSKPNNPPWILNLKY